MAKDWQQEVSQLGAEWSAGFDAAMDFHFVRASRDEVVLEYDIEAKHRQPYGIVHGGVHCAAIETTCSTGAAFDARSGISLIATAATTARTAPKTPR